MGNALAQISQSGVAVWLDDLSRDRLKNGSLNKLIQTDNVVGVTTNPNIFATEIGNSQLYQGDIKQNYLPNMPLHYYIHEMVRYTESQYQ